MEGFNQNMVKLVKKCIEEMGLERIQNWFNVWNSWSGLTQGWSTSENEVFVVMHWANK